MRRKVPLATSRRRSIAAASGASRRSRSCPATTCRATATSRAACSSPLAGAGEEARGRGSPETGASQKGMAAGPPPATTDAHRDLVRESFGIIDGWPVVTEPFKQWVIEDRFPLGRPQWERVGAQMVSDVHPYEMMKIRLLNASHQALCYIGMLLGYRYADATMWEP